MGKTVVIAVRITKKEREILDLIASQKGIDRSELIRRILRGYMKYHGYLP